MTTLERVDAAQKEMALRRRLDQTPWWVSQILPLPEGGWLVTITHQDAALRRAYTHEGRLEALQRAVEAAEGRPGPG